MNIVLFGITGLGNAVLEELIKNDIKPKLVVTRKEFYEDPHLGSQNLGLLSKSHNIETLYDKTIVKGSYDLCIVATYHKKIDLTKNNFGKSFNIHPSYLPNYKGKDPIKNVLKNKEKFTGVSVHILNNKLDSGKVIFKKKITISGLKNKGEVMLKMYPIFKYLTKKIIINFKKL